MWAAANRKWRWRKALLMVKRLDVESRAVSRISIPCARYLFLDQFIAKALRTKV